jgi:hypothetical protein
VTQRGKKEKCLFAQLSGHHLTDLESRVKSVAEPNLTSSSQKTCLFAGVSTQVQFKMWHVDTAQVLDISSC